jgi:hypothetical protein
MPTACSGGTLELEVVRVSDGDVEKLGTREFSCWPGMEREVRVRRVDG